MDPEELLKQLRELASRDHSYTEDTNDPLEDLERMKDAFHTLDEWLSKGGFSPWPSSSNRSVYRYQ